MASIIVDFDDVQKVHLDSKPWEFAVSRAFYNGSTYWPSFARSGNDSDTGDYGAISISFRGTSITFFGSTPVRNCSQYLNVSIDEDQMYTAFFEDPFPPSRQQLYQTPLLQDKQHTIVFTRIPAAFFDYVVITAGQDTPLVNQRLIVDDGDPSVRYAGDWNRNNARYARTRNGTTISGNSYGNATHDTSASGASATMSFNGSTLAMYGTIDYSTLGTVSVKYTLDGFAKNVTYRSTSEIQKSDLVYGNNLLFSDDAISSGDHTLTIEVLDCVNQTFSFDYFTYSPSFNTLANKPQTSSTTQINTSTTDSKKHGPVGAIVGGVVGGVVVLFLLLLLFLRRRKIFGRLMSKKTPPTIPSVIQPFRLPSPSTPYTPYVYTPIYKEALPTNSEESPLIRASTNPPTSGPTPYPRAMIADHNAIEIQPQRRNRGNGVPTTLSSPPPYLVQ